MNKQGLSYSCNREEEMGILTMEDINFFAQQSSRDINMILAGIIMLMNDTVNKANL